MPLPADLVAAARAAGITEQPVLDAIAAVPRADFVPPELVAWHTTTRPSRSHTTW
jgi:protein-L-isoaspartate O-methyltransferase